MRFFAASKKCETKPGASHGPKGQWLGLQENKPENRASSSLKRKQVITGSVRDNYGCGCDAMKAEPSRTQSTATGDSAGDSRRLEILRLSKSLLLTSSTGYSLKRQSLGTLQRCQLWRRRGMQRGNKGGFSSAPVFWDFLSLQPQFHKKHGPPGLG